MRAIKTTTERGETWVRIELVETRIEIRSEKNRYGVKAWTPATVNWSALGSVPAAAASDFAIALAFAVQLAARLDDENGVVTS